MSAEGHTGPDDVTLATKMFEINRCLTPCAFAARLSEFVKVKSETPFF